MWQSKINGPTGTDEIGQQLRTAMPSPLNALFSRFANHKISEKLTDARSPMMSLAAASVGVARPRCIEGSRASTESGSPRRDLAL
jgi:hypothetical protein